jgi:hypothetical protein
LLAVPVSRHVAGRRVSQGPVPGHPHHRGVGPDAAQQYVLALLLPPRKLTVRCVCVVVWPAAVNVKEARSVLAFVKNTVKTVWQSEEETIELLPGSLSEGSLVAVCCALSALPSTSSTCRLLFAHERSLHLLHLQRRSCRRSGWPGSCWLFLQTRPAQTSTPTSSRSARPSST